MTAASAASAPPTAERLDYPRIGLISLGHFTNDTYGNMMTSLTPYLILAGIVSRTQAGFVVLLYLIGSSVLQPAFGLISDRSGRRSFAVFGPLTVGVAASLFALAGNLSTLLLIACLGGLGTAAFHPQAASMVNALSIRNRGWIMAIFSMGGNVGFALGPLAAAVIARVGFHWAPILLIPGVVVTGLLFRFAPAPTTHPQTLDLRQIRSVFVRARRPLALIVAVIAIRSGAQVVMIIFLPLYEHLRGLPAQTGSYYAFALSLAGAAGGLIGGRLSDRLGRRNVSVVSLFVAAPLLALVLLVNQPIIWPLLVLAGATLLASNSITVVQGQELLPTNAGIASGLTLGLGFGLSGVASTALAALSDHVGVGGAIWVVPAMPFVAAVLAWLVPETQRPMRSPRAA